MAEKVLGAEVSENSPARLRRANATRWTGSSIASSWSRHFCRHRRRRYFYIRSAALFLCHTDPRRIRLRTASARHPDFLGHRGDILSRRISPSIWSGASARAGGADRCLATLVLLFVVTVQTYTLFDKVVSTYRDNVLTFDLRLPTWPFFLVAWLGDVSAVVLIAVRTYRLIFRPELMDEGGYRMKPVE